MSCIYSFGGITPLYANNIPTVYFFLFIANLSVLYYLDGIIPFYAKYNDILHL